MPGGKGLIMLGMLNPNEMFRYEGQTFRVVKNDGEERVTVRSAHHDYVGEMRANIYVYHEG